MNHRVTFLPGNISIEVDDRTTILQSALEAGVSINSVCGGKGTCGKCLVIVDGAVESLATERITKEEWAKGYRMACLTKIVGDVSVLVPEEARVGEHKILTSYVEGELEEISPLSETFLVDLSAPTLDDNVADLERLRCALGLTRWEVPLAVLQDLPHALRDNGWRVHATLTNAASGQKLIDISSGASVPSNCGLAVDIGTTTVVVSLIDLRTGRTIAQASDYNKQVVCGEDVLSRIAFAEEQGVRRLNELIVDTINSLVAQLCLEKDAKKGFNEGVCRNDVTAMSVGGNTTMIHFLLGLDATNIRYSPYIPITNVPPVLTAGEVGVNIHPQAAVYCVPGRASYVGGDITADLLVSGMHKQEELSLLIDVGTNGEVVVGNKDWMISCSTSAGPAFEGGEVTCGMRAMAGAIDSVVIKDYDIDITTIGRTEPIGICGSGLIDLIAEMFKRGLIDKKGRIEAREAENVRNSGRGMEFVLHRGSKEDRKGLRLRNDIIVTDDDIANVIRTKAAIYAGCNVLLRSVDKTFDDVARLYIAGGFGNFINTENAKIIGLLPDLPPERFVFLGNASLGGARLCLLSGKKRREAQEVYEAMTYLELATSQTFFDEFYSALFLPHTDMDRFPRVKKVLESKGRN